MTRYPDAKKHQLVSFLKSLLRITGFLLLPVNLVISSIILILAEVLGIVEELV